MKQAIKTALLCFSLLLMLPARAAALELRLGGQAVGIELKSDGVLVAGLADIETDGSTVSPAREAGVKQGDLVVAVGEREVKSAADFLSAVAALGGRETELRLLREGKELSLRVQPVLSREEQWMLGMWLRDSVNGIGTLTFTDPETGVFGALGHAVSDGESGRALPLGEGSISSAQVAEVKPGAEGRPGELVGCAEAGSVLGRVERNCERGIYGTLSGALEGRSVPVGELSPGPAELICTVSGGQAKSYEARIDRIYAENGSTRALLTVTDEELLAVTGGIVQGMSGSPLLQEGRLVGAVTHVFVDDPQRGYALSIQDMLEEAGLTLEQAA